MSTPPIEVSIGAIPSDDAAWGDVARRSESIGARALLVPDHPGTAPAPFVALAAAAAATSTIRLSSYVANAGVRDPIHLASEVATLDVVSGGRAELGIGAGHTPAEWEMIGRARPGAKARVERLIATTTAVRELLAGEVVPAGAVDALADLRLDAPHPVQHSVPVLVGGGNTELLQWAGGAADAVGLSGLGRTLADGHRHSVLWSRPDIDRQVDLVRQGAHESGRETRPMEALVQVVSETDDRATEADAMSRRLEVPVDELLTAPYVLIGSIGRIVEQLQQAREEWGITRWALREDSLDAAERIIDRLEGN